MRRALATSSALVAALAVAAGPARADPNASQQATATVYAAGSSPSTDSVSVGQLESGGCPAYTGPNIELHQADGSQGPEEQVSSEAWTLGALLGCLAQPVALGSVTGITIEGPNGPQAADPSQLTPPDLTPGGSDFANPQEYPLLYSTGSGLTYARPWRGGSDANASDSFTAADPTAFTFDVFEGPLLHVTASATPATTKPGQAIQFAANVTGAPAGATLSYAWTFDGAAPDSSAAAPNESFAAAGTYRVSVEVTDDQGGGGGATIPVTVSSSSTTTPPTSTTPHPTGPRVSHGTTPSAAPGRRRATPAGVRGSHAAPHSGRSPRGESGSRRQAEVGTLYTRGGVQPPNVSRRAQNSGSAEPHAPIIRGQLIADVTPLEPGSKLYAQLHPAAATAPALTEAARDTPLAPLLAALGTLALFGLGAVRELRR